ncbi:4'-phosphopantetheinyl transferase family protein [Clostridium botulinum]|uniref:4'-phosphopantetheinyl transferase family protein n=1 Tax=Clostridium botulinum TaxID=1491 RepID=UPI000D1369BC|nr:4'-phosphopantetheinyl transferase superfamily protein [Clostridium botulinum]AVQ44876.1 hypothetical protein C7M60_03360 [Clostridium botulinum]AVQ48947.1 hypothetical protein C7M58_06170 [Clostridium botulinum]
MKFHIFRDENLFKLSKIQLNNKENHVWVICWENIASWINKEKSVLNKNELKMAESFYFEEDKMRYMTGRILTKILSAYYLEIKSEEVFIEQDFYGKPFIVCHKEKRLYHNISHSGKYVLLVFTYSGLVGIDVEEEKYFLEYKELAKNFHKEEYSKICKSSDIHEFYRVWTAKEAYVKAIGKGLQINLNSFNVREDGIYQGGKKLEAWDLFVFKVADRYTTALVINKI